MTQILPAPPAPAPAPSTASSSTTSSGSSARSNGGSLEEFIAVLAEALNTVLDDQNSADGELALAPSDQTETETDLDQTDELDVVLELMLGAATPARVETTETPGLPAAAVDPEIALDEVPETGLAEVSLAADHDLAEGGLTADAEETAAMAPTMSSATALAEGPQGPAPGSSNGAVGGESAPQDSVDTAAAPTNELPGSDAQIPEASDEAEVVTGRIPSPPSNTPTTAVADDPALRASTAGTTTVDSAAEMGPTTATDPTEASLLDGDDPWSQLATAIKPLRQLPNGTHRLSLQLRPAELGAVQLEVAIENGQISVRAVAENIASRDVLASAMPELREELARSGIDVGSLDVGEHTSDGAATGGDPSDQGPQPANLGGTATSGPSGPTVVQDAAPTTVSPPGRLDLNL